MLISPDPDPVNVKSEYVTEFPINGKFSKVHTGAGVVVDVVVVDVVVVEVVVVVGVKSFEQYPITIPRQFVAGAVIVICENGVPDDISKTPPLAFGKGKRPKVIDEPTTLAQPTICLIAKVDVGELKVNVSGQITPMRPPPAATILIFVTAELKLIVYIVDIDGELPKTGVGEGGPVIGLGPGQSRGPPSDPPKRTFCAAVHVIVNPLYVID